MISLRHHQCIRRLVQKGGITQKNAIAYRFSSAAVKGIDDDDHLLNEEKKNLDGLFPWRSMPAMPQKTIQDHLSQHVCTYLLRRFYLQGTSIISPGSVINYFVCCTYSHLFSSNELPHLLLMN